MQLAIRALVGAWWRAQSERVSCSWPSQRWWVSGGVLSLSGCRAVGHHSVGGCLVACSVCAGVVQLAITALVGAWWRAQSERVSCSWPSQRWWVPGPVLSLSGCRAVGHHSVRGCLVACSV